MGPGVPSTCNGPSFTAYATRRALRFAHVPVTFASAGLLATRSLVVMRATLRQTRRVRLPPVAAMVAFVVVAALAAGTFPLLVYSTSLAAFGLAHVAAELWYVDHRFGRRVRLELVMGAAALLTAVVAVRVLMMTRVLSPPTA